MLVSVLNFFGFLNDGSLDRADELTVPAEMTMIAVGLYGLYFATVGWDLSNRRRKRAATGKSDFTALNLNKIIEIFP